MLLSATALMAVPAHRGTAQVRQPDGSMVTLRLHGDEWQHFHTTADGYSVVKDDRGCYVYAQLKDGRLVATPRLAHDADRRTSAEKAWLKDVRKYQTPALTEHALQLKSAEELRRAATLSKRRAGEYDYTRFRGLVILVEYSDCSFSRSDYQSVMNDMMNKTNYKGYDNTRYGKYTGSVRDYFVDNSNGLFAPQFDVVGPIRVSYSQYTPHATDSIDVVNYEALQKASYKLDFKNYDADRDGIVDMIYFVYAGLGANFSTNDQRLVWPHASYVNLGGSVVTFGGYAMGRYACSTEFYGTSSWSILDGIGTICHEFTHVLGLPDLYDTDYEKSGGESAHPDAWSVMAGGSYQNYGRTPVGYNLYERYSAGFMVPEVISSEGSKRLLPLALFNKGYRLNTEVENEFFLLENRQPSQFKWDEYLPGSGMLVWRVDSTNTEVWESNNVNINPRHTYFTMIRAGGGQGATAADAFPGTKKVADLDIYTSPANLKTWAGKSTPWGLYNIKEAGNIVSFQVRSPEAPDGIMLPKADDHPSDTHLYNLQGQRVGPTAKGLVVRKGKKLLYR